MSKRLLALLLTILMIILSFPINVFAAGVTCYSGDSCQSHKAAIGNKHYDTLDEAIGAAKDGDTIRLLFMNEENVPIVIRDKSITIEGRGGSNSSQPISHTFIIKHTTGGHTVTLKNIYWNLEGNSAVYDMSVCKDASDVNVLNITNCTMYVKAENKDNLTVVGIFGTQDTKKGICASGTKLNMTNNTIQTMHYKDAKEDEDGDTYFYGYAAACAVSLNCKYVNSYKFDMDSDVYHYAKHNISKNNFRGYFLHAIIGGNVDILENTIRLSYYSSYKAQKMGNNCIKICGASSGNNGGQLYSAIAGNKFYNFDGYVLTMALVDGKVASSVNSKVLITGNVGVTSGGTYYKPNTFDKVGKLVQYEKTGTSYSSMLSPDLMTKDWTGISDSNVSIYVGNIPFSKSGNVKSDYMLTESGILSKTYTQLPCDENARTGFFYDFQESGYLVRLWYLCTYGQNCYLLTDKNNNIYATYVSSSGISDTFKDYRNTIVPSNLARAEVSDSEATEYEAKLYSLGYKATVLDGNTYRNAIVNKVDDNTYLITADSQRGLTEKDIIVYLSDNGGNKVTYLTCDENEAVPSNGVRVVVPNIELTKVSYAGDKAINIISNVKELEVDSVCQVNVSASSNVDTLNVNSKATINNNGYITTVNVGHNDTSSAKRDDIQNNAKGAVIQNNKNIENIILHTAAKVNNGQKNYNVINKQASVNGITVGNPNAITFSNGNSTFFANGSIINNYGTIEGDKLNIYTASVVNNYGTIDNESIVIGYLGKNDDHSGTEINNYKDVIDTDFILYGSSLDKSFADTATSRPYIRGLNVGNMSGSFDVQKSTYTPYHGFLKSNSNDSISIFSENTKFDYPEYVNADNNEFDISTVDGVTGWSISSNNSSVAIKATPTGYHVSNMPTEAGSVKFTMKVPTIDTQATVEILVRATPEFDVPSDLTAEYNTMLHNIPLPEGFSWQDENDLVGELGEHTHYVKYTPQDLGTYHVVPDILVTVTVVKGTPEYTLPDIGTQEYGTKLKDIELPDGFEWKDKNSTVGSEGENTLYLTYTPKDTDRYKVLTDIEVPVLVVHHYNSRSNVCDFCGKINPEAKLKQIDNRLKSKNYTKFVDEKIVEIYPTFDELENALMNAAKGNNDFANPDKVQINNVSMEFKSNGKRVMVTEDNFPDAEVHCTYRYKNLKANDTYDFTVARLLSDGTIDYPTVVKNADGITFEIDSFGPILIAIYSNENTMIVSNSGNVIGIILLILVFLIAAFFVLYLMLPQFKEKIDEIGNAVGNSKFKTKIDRFSNQVKKIRKYNNKEDQ